MDKYYVRSSPVAEYINGFLEEKRSLGYAYIFEEYVLNEFDNYCVENRLSVPCFTRDFLSGWLSARNGEGPSYHSQRISFVRQLSLYMNSFGIGAYVPVETVRQERVVPHFLSGEERISFSRRLTRPNRVILPHTHGGCGTNTASSSVYCTVAACAIPKPVACDRRMSISMAENSLSSIPRGTRTGSST